MDESQRNITQTKWSRDHFSSQNVSTNAYLKVNSATGLLAPD